MSVPPRTPPPHPPDPATPGDPSRGGLSRRQALIAAGAGTAALAVSGAHGATAEAATWAPGASLPAGFYPFDVGALRCIALSDGALDFPTGFYGVNAPPEALSAELAANFLPTDFVHNQTTCLYVRTRGRRVLIDTGLEHDLAQRGGSLRPQLQGSGHLVANIRAAGVDPREIDAVILTHGHPDHVGGLVDARGRLNFPNAHYFMSEPEWKFWTQPKLPDALGFNKIVVQRTLPRLRKRMTLVRPGQEPVPNIHVIEAYGHTPGHIGLMIDGGREQLLHTCDAAGHYVIAMRHPDWYGGFDADGVKAVAARRRLMDQAATDRLLTLCSHFPWPSLGHVVAAEQAWRWEPVYWRWRYGPNADTART